MDQDTLLLKQLPHSVEAEQAVLGSMLIDPRCVPDVIETLRPDDFYLKQNKDIYETIYSMFNYSLTIDPVTTLENMKKNGVYDENLSYGYMLQLMDTTPTAANVKEYIDIMKDKTLLRRIAAESAEVQNGGTLTLFVEKAREACAECGVNVAEAYGRWMKLHESGVDVTSFISNGINHPNRNMHKLFAYAVLEAMFK